MNLISVIVRRLLGARRPEDRVVDQTITELERGEHELDRRLTALRAQVQAQTGWREGRQAGG